MFFVEIRANSITYTRRSAGLPCFVHAIIDAQEHASGKTKFVDLVCNEIFSILESEDGLLSQVHAFNLLRFLLKNAKIVDLTAKYVEQAMLCSLHLFSSQHFPVRNSACMTFACIFRRIFGAKPPDSDAPGKKIISTREFEKRFPLLWIYLLDHLSSIAMHAKSLSDHGTLHSMLLIIAQCKHLSFDHQFTNLFIDRYCELLVKPASRDFVSLEHYGQIETLLYCLFVLTAFNECYPRKQAARAFIALCKNAEWWLKHTNASIRECLNEDVRDWCRLHGLLMCMNGILASDICSKQCKESFEQGKLQFSLHHYHIQHSLTNIASFRAFDINNRPGFQAAQCSKTCPE